MIAIVLSRHDYREFDQLITLFSYERGKEIFVAKGVKKIVSKNSPFLEPGVVAEVEVVPGSEFLRLIRATPLFVGAAWRADFSCLRAATVLLSLVEQVLPMAVPEKNVFVLLEQWFRYLDLVPTKESIENSVAACVMRIMGVLGFRPVLEQCVAGHAWGAEEQFFIDVTQGGVSCALHIQTVESRRFSLGTGDLRRMISFMNDGFFGHNVVVAEVIHRAIWSLASQAFDRALPRWWVSI
jgi:DNA repair protein RecO (recombination protein O)